MEPIASDDFEELSVDFDDWFTRKSPTRGETPCDCAAATSTEGTYDFFFFSSSSAVTPAEVFVLWAVKTETEDTADEMGDIILHSVSRRTIFPGEWKYIF